jgi:hypothetical protein
MTDGKVLEPLEALQAMAERTRLRDSRAELALAMAEAAAVQVPRPTLRDEVLGLEPHEAAAWDWAGEQMGALVAASSDKEGARGLLNSLSGQHGGDPIQRYTVFKATALQRGIITQAVYDAAPRYRPLPPVDTAALAEQAEAQAIFEAFSRVIRAAHDPGMAAQINNNQYAHKQTRKGLTEFTRQVRKDVGMSDVREGPVTQQGRVTTDPITGKAVKR